MKECECGNPRTDRRPGCLMCRELERQRKEAESPTALIISAIRHQGEWLSAVEIAAAAGIDSADTSARLSWLKRRGDVESRWEKGFGMVYRLTERRAA